MDKNSEKEVRKGFYYDIMDSNHYVISTYDTFGHLYTSLSNIILKNVIKLDLSCFGVPFKRISKIN